jgi:hypothetical protein
MEAPRNDGQGRVRCLNGLHEIASEPWNYMKAPRKDDYGRVRCLNGLHEIASEPWNYMEAPRNDDCGRSTMELFEGSSQ